VPGQPTGMALTPDGTMLLVGYEGRFGIGGGLVAYLRTVGSLAKRSVVSIEPGVKSVAVTPDGRTAVVATQVGLAAVDIASLAAGKVRPVAVRDGDAPASNQVAVSRDGRHAFYTNEGSATLGVARIGRDATDAPSLSIVGHVKLDRLPGGMALSSDGLTLYVTSEIDTADPTRVSGASDARLGRDRCASNLGPHGVLSLVDTTRAVDDPEHAVSSRVAAGCGPVRVTLAPGGDVAWVSIRGENRVLAFDTARLRTEPERALLAAVAVGDVPVGLATSPDGRTLLVVNSHRSRDPDEVAGSDLSVVDTAAALSGAPAVRATLATGALSREVLAAPDGTFYVTNYGTRRIDVVTPARIAGGS
jgi:DNA-binding beta-propeller fold protein YncE